MKEMLYQWLEPVLESAAVKMLIAHPFLFGLLCGVVLFWVLRFFWWLFFRRKNSSYLLVGSGEGQISISVAAITGVVKHAVRELNSLEILRVRIAKSGKLYNFDLRIRMDAANGTAPQLSEKLSVIVREQMKNAFGIENIGKIKLTIVNCDNSRPEIVDEPEISEEPEKKTAPHVVKLNVKPDAENGE